MKENAQINNKNFGQRQMAQVSERERKRDRQTTKKEKKYRYASTKTDRWILARKRPTGRLVLGQTDGLRKERKRQTETSTRTDRKTREY